MIAWEGADWIGLAAVITAGSSLIAAFRSTRAAAKSEEAAVKGAEAVTKVNMLEVKIDGRLTQLLERTAIASRLEGVDVGRGQMAAIPVPTVTTVVDPAQIQEDGTLVVGVPNNPTPPVLLVPVEEQGKEKEKP